MRKIENIPDSCCQRLALSERENPRKIEQISNSFAKDWLCVEGKGFLTVVAEDWLCAGEKTGAMHRI